MNKSIFALSLMMTFGLAASAHAASGDTLAALKQRGALACTSGSESFQAFAEVDAKGAWKGLDIDHCRAVAVAIFGNDKSLKLNPISWAQRFPALQSGELDLVIKASGWTMSRDTELGLQPSAPYFIGATQFMAKAELNLKAATDAEGGTVCTTAGTSTEALIANYMKSKNVKVELVTFEKTNEAQEAFFNGRCDLFGEWAPVLATSRAASKNPDDFVILPDVIAMEPEVAWVRQGDDQWLDIVNWVIAATRIAEQYGITSANVDQMKANPPDATVGKLLGATPGIGSRLGLSDDWAYNVIKIVGNSGEVYERSIGEGSPYKLPRGMNALWSDGGVFFAPILD